MRLLLDLQCVQSSSSKRGIGRYSLSLARALVERAGPHRQVEVLLNAGDDSTRLLRARNALETFLPPGSVHVFDAAWPWQGDRSPTRRLAAEAARTAAIASLRPDAVLIGSMFEGDTENVVSVPQGGRPPTAALLFDLIPAAEPATYLLGPGADIYWRRFEEFARTDLLLSISDYSAAQARTLLPERCPPTVTIWGGPYPSGAFPAFEYRTDQHGETTWPDSYLLAVGGDHPRKNLDRLVAAWGRVPVQDRGDTALVVACNLNVGTLRRLRRIARRSGLGPSSLVLTGEVSEPRLHDLYRGALAFVFPSTEEGLGMPPLEAMAHGCPTLLARGSSLDELVDDTQSFVDGYDVDDIERGLRTLVVDAGLREHLRNVAVNASKRFTWHRSADLAWAALEQLCKDTPGQISATPPPGVPVDVPNLPAAPSPVLVCGDVAFSGADEWGFPHARADLAPATALVVPDVATARRVVAAGLVGQPVVLDALPPQVVDHDPVPYQAELLSDLVLPAALARDVVRAAAHPARWTLERPGPVVLLLTDDAGLRESVCVSYTELLLCAAPPEAADLAVSVDHVVVPSRLVMPLLAELQQARRFGTGVAVVGAPDEDIPSGLPEGTLVLRLTGPENEPDSWIDALDRAWDRRTGWPWRVRR